MFCTRCGRQQRDTSEFCRSCGARSLLSTPIARPIARKAHSPALVALLLSGCMAIMLIIALPIVVIAMRPTPTTTPPPEPCPANLEGIGELYAVVVGVSDYQYDCPSFSDIPGPDKGASAMTDIMTGLWGDDAHVRLLVNEDANKANVRLAIASIALEADKDDIVLFYFTGHGNEQYILPYDSLPASYSNDVSPGLLDQWLDALNSDKVIVVIDSCGSGGYAEIVSGSGRVVLASCAANESASTELSYYISAGLKKTEQLDSDSNRLISIEEIYANLKSQRISGQHPQLADGYAGELVLLSLESQ